jgi:hypothetical protein
MRQPLTNWAVGEWLKGDFTIYTFTVEANSQLKLTRVSLSRSDRNEMEG